MITWLGEQLGAPFAGLLVGLCLESMIYERLNGDLIRGAGALTAAFVLLSAHTKLLSLAKSIPADRHVAHDSITVSANLLRQWSIAMFTAYPLTVCLHAKTHVWLKNTGRLDSDFAGLSDWGILAINILILACAASFSMKHLNRARTAFAQYYRTCL